MSEVWPQGWQTAIKLVEVRDWQFDMLDIAPKDNRVCSPQATSLTTTKAFGLASDRASPYAISAAIMSEYSRRRLSYLDDRLVALAGITSEFKTLMNDEFLHGFWKKDLCRGILFRRLSNWDHNNKSRSQDMSKYENIPSWSWLRHGVSVYWQKNLWDANVVELCQVRLSDRNVDSVLELMGILAPVVSDKHRGMLLYMTVRSFQITGDWPEGIHIKLYPDQEFTSEFVDSENGDDDAAFQAAIQKFRATSLLMPIVYFPDMYRSNEGHVDCLLLRGCPSQGDAVYRRIGMAQITVLHQEVNSDLALGQIWTYRNSHTDQDVGRTDVYGRTTINVV